MPEVRSIERRGRRVTVEFDGAAPLACDRGFLLSHAFRVGESIEGPILERVREQAFRHDARAWAERWLRGRPLPRGAVARRLAQRGIPAAIVEETLDALQRRGFLDDAAYASLWAEDRGRRRPRSARMVEAELRAQGVEAELASAATAAIDDEAMALELARQRARRFRGDWATFERRVGGALVRRGFPHELARRTLRVVWREIESSANESAGEGGDGAGRQGNVQ